MIDHYDYPVWPCRLKPKPDEALSSWLVRQSAGLFVKLQTFTTRHLGLGPGFWTSDVDRCLNQQLFSRLSEYINVPLSVVNQTSLSAYTGRLWEHLHSGQWAFITSVGRFGRKRVGYGQQYCRICLAEDAEPYFRKSWRLAFNVSCSLHNTYLRDCCPSCKNPLVFHTGDFGKLLLPETCQIAICQYCKSDFRNSPFDQEIEVSKEIKDIQCWLNGVLQEGFGTIDGGREYPALLIFNGIRKLVSTYTSVTRLNRISAGMRQAYGDLDLYSPSIQQANFETLRIGDRVWALRVLYSLLDDWPNSFVRACVQNHISSSYLNYYRGETPYWLWKEMHWHLNDKDYAPTVKEVESVQRYLQSRELPDCRSEINTLLGTSAISAKNKPVKVRWNPRGPQHYRH